MELVDLGGFFLPGQRKQYTSNVLSELLDFVSHPLYCKEAELPDGKVLKIPKIRTMERDAHTRLSEVLEKFGYNGNGRPQYDPRVLSLPGIKLLRALHLDELPQVINWFKKNLQTFGVRPHSKEDWDQAIEGGKFDGAFKEQFMECLANGTESYALIPFDLCLKGVVETREQYRDAYSSYAREYMGRRGSRRHLGNQFLHNKLVRGDRSS